VKSTNLIMSVFLSVVCIFFSIPINAQAEINVYDANGQFLGIFLGYNQGVSVFVPSLNAATGISETNGAITVAPYLFFESTDCTGKPFMYPSATYNLSRVGADNYLGEHIAPIQLQMHSQSNNGTCSQASDTFRPTVVPAQKVTELPFTVPVALPMRFDYRPQTQTATIPAIGTVGLIVVSILFSISAIIRIRRKEKLSIFEAIKRMVIFKM
jgi:hypothetical protein